MGVRSTDDATACHAKTGEWRLVREYAGNGANGEEAADHVRVYEVRVAILQSEVIPFTEPAETGIEKAGRFDVHVESGADADIQLYGIAKIVCDATSVGCAADCQCRGDKYDYKIDISSIHIEANIILGILISLRQGTVLAHGRLPFLGLMYNDPRSGQGRNRTFYVAGAD